MYVNETYTTDRPISPKLPAVMPDSARGVLARWDAERFRAFCRTHQSLQRVVSVQSIVQNKDDARFNVTLECECTREIVQLVARSEKQKSTLKASKAKSAKARKEIEEQETKDVTALAMDEPPEPVVSDTPSELSCGQWGGVRGNQ
jgi:hypothetical protein